MTNGMTRAQLMQKLRQFLMALENTRPGVPVFIVFPTHEGDDVMLSVDEDDQVVIDHLAKEEP